MQDRFGRFVTGIAPSQLHGARGRRAAEDRPGPARDAAGHLHAAHRQQPEHVAPHGLRSRRRGDARRLPPAEGPRHRRAVLDDARHGHGADRGPRRRCARPSAQIRSSGGTAIARLPDRSVARMLERRRRPPHHRAHHRRLRREQQARRSRTRSRQSRRPRATVYVVGIGGVAGISMKGEHLLQQICRRHRRPRVLPGSRNRARGRFTS